MTSDSPSMDEPLQQGRLSPNGQMIAIGVYGFLVLVGFSFGIVTGYERAKPPVVVAKAPKEKEPPRPSENPKPTPPKAAPVTPPTTTPEPKEEPRPEPKVEPKKEEPKKEEPKKVEPKKVEPKKEEFVPVSYKELVPVLKKHCYECHGAGKPQGRVDVTSVAKMMMSKGKVIVPGKPDESSLYTSSEDGSMPKDRPKIPDKDLAIIRNWILSGAKERRRRRPG